MTNARKLVLTLIGCAVVAWLIGPPSRMVVVLLLLLFGPGFLFDSLLSGGTPRTRSLFVRPALWLAFSISLVAILYTWALLPGLRLTPPVLAVLAAGCALACAWRAWTLGGPGSSAPPQHAPSLLLAPIGLLVVLACTVWTRFYQIRDLALPAWVDSVHHALLIRVAVEQGQAPASLRPYLPIDNLPYHWGYHSFMAPVVQLSDLPLAQTMLYGGQILNTLHALVYAALATYFWRRPFAGVVAALVVGVASIMPAFYVSWGRYTQLTGLLILPALAICWHALLHTPTRGQWARVGVLLAGQAIIHTRVLLLALALLACITVVWALRVQWAELPRRLPVVVAAGMFALVLAAPWLANLAVHAFQPVEALPQSLNVAGGESYNRFKEGLLWSRTNPHLIVLALLGALWLLWRRSTAAATILGWTVSMFVMANPWLLTSILPAAGGILALAALWRRQWLLFLGGAMLLLLNPALVTVPYTALITNDVVIISLFVPIALLISGSALLLYDWLARALAPTRAACLMPAAALVLLAVALGWSTWNLRDVINYPETVFTSRADVAALAWVETHTPPDARFLINAKPWFPNVDRGTDGGWWLMPLTGRWTTTPPAIYDYGAPAYAAQVHELSRSIASFTPENLDDLLHLIEREGITHLYLGQNAAPVTPELFAANEAFEVVYAHEGVTILAVQRQALVNR